ncbi:hypothetical protein [Pseudactinotalea sp. Z1748]|uniref:hypothetical protein n=1 Tax=Pseudactinotalea sp. Z1748 TaxID=3413027 RepID=UPI003C7CE760
MGILDRLSDYLRGKGARGSSTRTGKGGGGVAPGEPVVEQEGALRERLDADPNDLEAFAQLAELVRRRTESTEHPDPLIAAHAEADVQARSDASHWALAEELAGNPRAWYPLIELARLSLEDDHEGALRRLGTACERDRSGRALEEGIKMLRGADLPAEALSLGVGHWSPAQQSPEAGRQVVQAALDAGRATAAREHLRNLAEYGTEQPGTTAVVAELEPFVAAAEARAERTD